MLRRWARGLLALLVCIALLQGGVLAGMTLAKAVGAADAHSMSASSMELQPGTLSAPKAVEASSSRVQQAAKRDHRLGGGPGDDKIALLLLIAIVVLLGPRLTRTVQRRAAQVSAPAASRPQAAGRCPTGPPAFA